jgi:monoamine oxidase
VRLGKQVISILDRGEAVDVAFRDTATGTIETRRSDHLVLALPLPMLAQLKTNFAPDVQAAFRSVAYHTAVKVAWESPRFWETEDDIYGGISWVDGDTRLVWYPSNDLQAAKGTLIGAYVSGDPARLFGDRPLPDQIAASRAAVERLHPGKGRLLAKPVAVDWHRVPHNLGSWVRWEDRDNAPEYRLLNRPHGRVLFAGEHLSQYEGGWQEGAALSGQRAVSALADRLRHTA